MLRPDFLIPLNSGAYQSRGPAGLNQICQNLYQEVNPENADPEHPVVHFTRPGLISFGSPGTTGVGRGVFTMSNGNCYAAVGQFVYSVDGSGIMTQIGQIGPQSTPVSMVDNGQTAVVVDGTHTGYQFDLGTNAFSAIFDPTGQFQGSVRTDYADSFLIFATPGTRDWFTSLSNQVAFNALINAAKSSYPDPIQTLGYLLREVWLIGSQRSEVWYLSGGANFPYNEFPNVDIQYGTIAPYSFQKCDQTLLWLSRNTAGQVLVLQTQGYGVNAISTRALETEWTNYPNPQDAVAYAYQQGGHIFYVITFQQANKTWAYDLSTKQWHQRGWIDRDGSFNRERVMFATNFNNYIVGQDWQTGELYKLDLNTFSDKGTPIVCRRSFPHVLQGLKEVTHADFVADMAYFGVSASGGSDWNNDYNLDFGPLAVDNMNFINFRYSSNGGVSWSNYRRKGIVPVNNVNYRALNRWRGLGMARDRVYEVSWSIPALMTLQGAWLEPNMHST
jgi:hypothetical protein